MMMDRRHFENTLFPELVTAHLKDHAHHFDHKHSPNEDQQDLLLDQHRDDSHRAAERKRADIPHKYVRRMRVPPEETETRAGHRPAKDGELGGPRIPRE